MDFNVVFSLKHLAVISYATSLINDSHVLPCLLQLVKLEHYEREQSCFIRNYALVLDLAKFAEKKLEPLSKYDYPQQLNKEIYCIIKKLKQKNLPKLIHNEIICAVFQLLKVSQDWYEMLVCRLDINHFHKDAVYYTSYGTIDTAKIITREWKKWLNRSGELILTSYKHPYPIIKNIYRGFYEMSEESEEPYPLNYSDSVRFAKYYMACACVLENYIRSNSYEILEFCATINERIPLFWETDKVEIKEFIIYSVLFFINPTKFKLRKFKVFLSSHKHVFQKFFVNVNLDPMFLKKKSTVNVTMFSKSVEQGCEVATKYYWGLLTSQEKNKKLVPITFRCNTNAFSLSTFRFHGNVLVFLLMQMSEDQRRDFLNDEHIISNINSKCCILKVFIDYSPWNKLFYPVFEAVKSHFKKRDYFTLLQNILDKMLLRSIKIGEIYESGPTSFDFFDEKIGYDSEKTLYHRMFLYVFEEMRNHTAKKKPLLIPNYTKGNDFLKLFNIPILKLIFDSECEDKKTLLNDNFEIFENLAFSNKFQLLDKFVDEVLSSDHEREWFRKNFKYTQNILCKYGLRAVDNVLDWQSNSDEERKKLKYMAMKQLDLMGYCGMRFLNNGGAGPSPKELKDWGFSNEKDRENYLNEFKEDKIPWLNIMWGSCEDKEHWDHVKKAKKNTNNFLKFFLDTNEEVAKFKTKKLINVNVVKNFLSYVSREESCTKVLIELILFCLLPEDTVRFRKNVMINFDEWLLFLSENRSFKDIDPYFDWIYNNQSEKEKAIKLFLNSENRFLLFENIFEDQWLPNYWENKLCASLTTWIKISVAENKIEDYFKTIFFKFKEGNKDRSNKYLNKWLKEMLDFRF